MDNDLLTAELDAKAGRMTPDRMVDLIHELQDLRERCEGLDDADEEE